MIDGAPLLIRADASIQIGSGHVMRCLALAQEWQKRGGQVTFLSHCRSDALCRRIISSGADFVFLPRPYPDSFDLQTTLSTLGQLASGGRRDDRPWLILDGYHYDPGYQHAVRRAGYRILIIDDNAIWPHYHADIVLNQNIHAPQLTYRCDPGTRLLLGTRYALLRPEFLIWQGWQRVIPNTAGKVLVTLGGSDPDNVTLKVIKALKMLDGLNVYAKVVAGPANPHFSDLQQNIQGLRWIELLAEATDMPGLMAWADIGVSAGGSTCWEMAFMGLPNIVLTLADNQRLNAEGLHEAGVSLSLGWHAGDALCDNVAQAMRTLLSDNALRMQMSQKGRQLVDGRGTPRVVSTCLAKPIQLRPVTEEDCSLLWGWVNDPAVRSSAISSKLISWEEHTRWFARKLKDPHCFIFIALDGDKAPVGQIRFDQELETDATVDVSIAPGSRGAGYGSMLIEAGVLEVFRNTSIRRANAFVKMGNGPSQSAFEKAGFVSLGVKTIGAFQVIHYVREKTYE